jgi:phage shock protein A
MKKIATISATSHAAHKANFTRKIAKLERALGELQNRAELAFAACRSIRFANDQAVRHGGDYSLNDLLAADKLAREALAPANTPANKGGTR